MKLTRSAPIQFERADSTQIIAQPATRGIMRDVLLLDLDPAEDLAVRRGEQVAIFLRGAVWLKADGKTSAGTLEELLFSLNAAEEIDIIHAITVQHHGFQPEDAVALQQAFREILEKKKNWQRLNRGADRDS
ncbi:hypothetical protein BH09VER1_BH09VER1_24520 [soil metagenome]